MEQSPLVQRMIEIVETHDLEALRQQILAALADLPEDRWPHVPAHLAKSLHMFVDSYGTDHG